jgi:hypothetical protein
MGWYGGTGGRQVLGPQRLAGVQQVTPTADPTTGIIECHWTNPYHLHVPTTWLSGIYLVKLHGNTSGLESYIIFTVRDSRHADVVFQQSVNTYEAYNPWPRLDLTPDAGYGGYVGASLYAYQTAEDTCSAPSCGPDETPGSPDGRQASQVSFDRPYGRGLRATTLAGVGAGNFLTMDYAAINGGHPQEQAEGVGGPSAWEFDMLRWLEHHGYDVTYITNVDTHDDVNQLLRGKVFLSNGHDEYWSDQMRQNVFAARDQGVSLGFFSGNYVFWAVYLLPDSGGSPDRTIELVDRTKSNPFSDMGKTEQTLTGGMWRGNVGNGDIVVPNDAPLDHWVFANTGLHAGDVIPGMIGYEFDVFRPDFPQPSGLQILLHTQAPNFLAGGGFPFASSFDGKSFDAWYDAGGTFTVVHDATTGNGWGGDETSGAMAYDTAMVQGGTGSPTGTLTYSLFSNGDCTGPAATTETVTLSGGLVPNSATSAPLSDGLYSYQTSYSGDSNHIASTSSCEPFNVGVPQTSTAACEHNPIPPFGINPGAVSLCSNPYPQGPVPPDLKQDWAMTIYQASSGAWVFNAATIQWAWGLDDYFTGLKTADGANNGPAIRLQCGYPFFHPGLVSCRTPAIEQITTNVLNRLIAGP